MIQVSIDLNSYGLGIEIETLCTIRIWNDGTGTLEIGNYGYEIRDKNNELMKKGEIKNFHRKNNHVIILLQKVINDAYPK